MKPLGSLLKFLFRAAIWPLAIAEELWIKFRRKS